MADITTYEPEDDGFNGSVRGIRGGNYLKWAAATHWTDRDGLTPPSSMLVFGIDEFLRRWKGDGQPPEIITAKPLPDVDDLNAAIPEEQWPIGLDGHPRAPWEHTIGVALVNPVTGESYAYAASTTGAHIAYDLLREQVIVMRTLRGEKVMPLVNLTERAMKSKRWGKVTRPHFEIIGWRGSGGGGGKTLPNQSASAPQLSGPSAAATPSTPLSTAATTPAATTPTPAPKAKAKATIDISTGPSGLTDVEPVSSAELLNDSIPV